MGFDGNVSQALTNSTAAGAFLHAQESLRPLVKGTGERSSMAFIARAKSLVDYCKPTLLVASNFLKGEETLLLAEGLIMSDRSQALSQADVT